VATSKVSAQHVRERFSLLSNRTPTPSLQLWNDFLQRCLPCAWFDPQIISYLIWFWSCLNFICTKYLELESQIQNLKKFQITRGGCVREEIMRGSPTFRLPSWLHGSRIQGRRHQRKLWTRVVPWIENWGSKDDRNGHEGDWDVRGRGWWSLGQLWCEASDQGQNGHGAAEGWLMSSAIAPVWSPWAQPPLRSRRRPRGRGGPRQLSFYFTDLLRWLFLSNGIRPNWL